MHAASHGAGLILSIAGLAWMLNLSIGADDSWRIIASSIYGASLISLFLSSTLYHGLHASPHKSLFKLLDHSAIYALIAGTSTLHSPGRGYLCTGRPFLRTTVIAGKSIAIRMPQYGAEQSGVYPLITILYV